MPRPKKLPEIDTGKEKKDEKKKIIKRFNWYDADGKRRGKTLTAYSPEEMAVKIVEWNTSIGKIKKPSMTILEAVEEYIKMRESVLSPVTIKQYYSIKDTHIKDDPIADVDINELTPIQVQAWINQLAEKSKPKTVKNCYGFLRSSINMHRKEFDFTSIRLPQPVRYKANTPGDKEVQKFIQYIKEKDRNLYLAVLLAAFGPMRRSEICALTSDDIKGSSVTVHRAKVPVHGGGWAIKEAPKTDASNRTITFPSFVAKELKGISGPVVTCSPTHITKMFKKEMIRAGLPVCRFHDLRHYGASIMHAIGVPDVYIIERGGWSSDHVMKAIYRDSIDAEKRKQTAAINEHFAALVQ